MSKTFVPSQIIYSTAFQLEIVALTASSVKSQSSAPSEGLQSVSGSWSYHESGEPCLVALEMLDMTLPSHYRVRPVISLKAQPRRHREGDAPGDESFLQLA